MILQSLANYYIRRANGPNCGGRVAPYGMEYKEIKFVIEIDEEGNFVNLVDMRDDKNNGRIFLVPKMMVRTTDVNTKKLHNIGTGPNVKKQPTVT